MQQELHDRIRRTAERIAESAGAKAQVTITKGTAVTHNDLKLTDRMLPTLKRVAGESNVSIGLATTTSEDFSHYQKEIPGIFFFLGITPKGREAVAAPNHSPRFFADEGALRLGIRALANLAVDYLAGK
jgi:amidohydrolase